MKNHCLNQKTNFRLSLNYAKESCFHWNLMMSCVKGKGSSFRLNSNVKEPESYCAEAQNSYLNGQVVSWCYFVVPGNLNLTVTELNDCYLAENMYGC